MKKIFSILCMALAIVSCQDLEEINQNPNSPETVDPEALLPTICSAAFTRGGDGMYARKMVVQTDGHSSEQFYEWSRGDFNTYTNTGGLKDVMKMEEEAERTSAPVYTALAKFFRAYYFYNLTLTFGDIPCSEALKGESKGNFTPKYDMQEEVFAQILDYLDEVDTGLSSMSAATIISGDIIYDGDITKWIKLVNSFHLKVLLTLSRKTTVGSHHIQSEFSTVAQKPLMESNDDNGQLTYMDQQGNRYPQFNAQWSGYYMDQTYIDRMAARKDPRLFLFALPTNEANSAGTLITDFSAYAGGDPVVPYGDNIGLVSAGKISPINDRFRTSPEGEPTMLMGYAELQQVLAEASVRGWISGDAKMYYENGVKASFGFYNTYAGDYAQYVTAEAAGQYLAEDLVAFDKATTTDEKIERIVMQKYLVAFYQGGWDAYFESLRTGYPDFAHVAGTTLPYRWIYPTDEYQNNTDHVTEAITRQFGADNDKTTAKSWWLQ